jgi:hypothetical protein
MTSGKRITPEMQAYILANQGRMFPAEIAYNLGVLYGVSITKDGVRKHLQRLRRAPTACR